MATLLEDIKTQSDWIVKAFNEDKLKLDSTIHSFINIDKFFNQNTKNGRPIKRLSKNAGPIIFSIGAYIGETIIKNIPGSFWLTDDDAQEGELFISVTLPDGTIIWPVQKVIKRFQNGTEDSIYVYGHHLTKDFINEPFDQDYWDIEKKNTSVSKPWWKIW